MATWKFEKRGTREHFLDTDWDVESKPGVYRFSFNNTADYGSVEFVFDDVSIPKKTIFGFSAHEDFKPLVEMLAWFWTEYEGEELDTHFENIYKKRSYLNT